MQIKTEHGEYDVPSQGKTNTALGLGIAGLATSLLGGSMAMMGGNNGYGYGRNGYFNGNDPLSRVITKAEADLMQENGTLKSQLAIKESEGYTDKKLVEVTTYVNNQMRRLEDKVDANKDMQQAVNAQQGAYNAAATASIEVMKSQIAALTGVTKVYIPSTNVCQTGCGCGCSAQ